MNSKTQKALLNSIEHWHQNLNILILNHLSNSPLTTNINMTASTCPLCSLFFDSNCKNCPITINNPSHCACTNTPYIDAANWFYNGLTNHDYSLGYEVISNELEFLISLLPTT